MKFFIILLLCLGFSNHTFAKTLTLQNSSYEIAEKSANFIRFDMKSTKIGLITTSFTGFVKNAKIDYEESPTAYKNIAVSFLGRDLDTNISGRNEKMWSLCLETEKHSQIVLKIPEISKVTAPFKVAAEITVRGKTYPIQIEVGEVSEQIISGQADLSLKGLDIPDPSILVAKVKDLIQIRFHLSQ